MLERDWSTTSLKINNYFILNGEHKWGGHMDPMKKLTNTLF